MIAIALAKSPVSLTRSHEVPHIFTRKPRLRPAEFLTTCAKRLLQHNRGQTGLGVLTVSFSGLDPMQTSSTAQRRRASRSLRGDRKVVIMRLALSEGD